MCDRGETKPTRGHIAWSEWVSSDAVVQQKEGPAYFLREKNDEIFHEEVLRRLDADTVGEIYMLKAVTGNRVTRTKDGESETAIVRKEDEDKAGIYKTDNKIWYAEVEIIASDTPKEKQTKCNLVLESKGRFITYTKTTDETLLRVGIFPKYDTSAAIKNIISMHKAHLDSPTDDSRQGIITALDGVKAVKDKYLSEMRQIFKDVIAVDD